MVPKISAVVMVAPALPGPVDSLVPAATNLKVLAPLVAMEVMAWPSLSADETTVPETTWYLSKFASTA